MLQIKISKEIREYKPKFVGSFTLREAVCALCAIIIAGVVYWLEKRVLALPTVSFLPAVPFMAIPLFFGFGERFLKMPPEKWVVTVLVGRFRKTARPYKTHNYYSIFLHQQEVAEAAKEEKSGEKKAANSPKNEEKRKLPPELKGFA